MKQKWGREGYAGEWPSSKPVWTIGAFFLALLAAGAIYAYRYERVWTPLEKHYLTIYLGTEGAGAIRKDGWYTLLMAETRKGTQLALDEEVQPVTTASGEETFALTDEAVKAGVTKLEWRRGKYDNAKLHQALAQWIYNDQTPAKPALWGGLGVFLVGLIVAIPKDAARRRERKEGRRLKGPELVTVREFNRRNHSDGIGFVQERTAGGPQSDGVNDVGCRRVAPSLIGLTMLGAASLVIFKGAGFDFPTHFDSWLDLPPSSARGIIRHSNRLTAWLLPPAV